MEASISQFIEEMKTSPKKLGIKKLRQREEIWRALWSWLNDEAKFDLLRIGSIVRMVRRDYKGVLGELGQIKFVADEYEITVLEKVYNYNDGKYYYESKVIQIPAAAIMWKEYVTEQELVEEEEEFEVKPLEEEDAITTPFG